MKNLSFPIRLLLLQLALCCLSSIQAQVLLNVKLPPAMQEISGLTVTGPATLWAHNDSGDEPCLYRLSPAGSLLDTLCLPGAGHTDWEGLTHDPAGNLYIGDFGNNFSQRQNLRIYRYHPGRVFT